jgi:hypothetical protein
MNVFTNALRALRVGGSPPVNEDLREFLAQSDVRAFLEKSGGPGEEFMRSEMLLIFDTRIQHTWLLATNLALYCIIDTRRQPTARRLWRIARSDIERDGKLILEIRETALSDQDNYLIIDGKRPRKFTKRIFQTLTIRESVENMLRNAFQLSPGADP